MIFDNANLAIKGKTIFKNLSFEFLNGLLLVTGASGSGKSSFVDCLLGYLQLTSGKVSLSSTEDIQPGEAARASYISYAGERETIIFNETIDKNIDLLCPTKEEAKRTTDILDTLLANQWKGHELKEFSGGERRKIELAFAIGHSRPIAILDEPFSGIDQQDIPKIKKLIFSLSGTIVVVDNLDAFKDDEIGARLEFSIGTTPVFKLLHSKDVKEISQSEEESTEKKSGISASQLFRLALHSFFTSKVQTFFLCALSLFSTVLMAFAAPEIYTDDDLSASVISINHSSYRYIPFCIHASSSDSQARVTSFLDAGDAGEFTYYPILSCYSYKENAKDVFFSLYVLPSEILDSGTSIVVSQSDSALENISNNISIGNEKIPVQSVSSEDIASKLETHGWYSLPGCRGTWGLNYEAATLYISPAEFEAMMNGGGLSSMHLREGDECSLSLAIKSVDEDTVNLCYGNPNFHDFEPFNLVSGRTVFSIPNIEAERNYTCTFGSEMDQPIECQTTEPRDVPSISFDKYILLMNTDNLFAIEGAAIAVPTSDIPKVLQTCTGHFNEELFCPVYSFGATEDRTIGIISFFGPVVGALAGCVFLLICVGIRKRSNSGRLRLILSVNGIEEKKINTSFLEAIGVLVGGLLILGTVLYCVGIPVANILLMNDTLANYRISSYGEYNPAFIGSTNPIPFYQFSWTYIFVILLLFILGVSLFILTLRKAKKIKHSFLRV